MSICLYHLAVTLNKIEKGYFVKKALLPFIILSAMLSGCATQPPKAEDIKLAPKDRLYDQNLYKPDETRTIPVKITRDVGLRGSLATVFLKIDGNYVVWLNMSEEITIYLAQGGYVFELVHSLCPKEQLCSTLTDVTIKSGFDNNFRIHVDDGFSLIRSKT
ncbi:MULTISPECIES: hypothetical protein [Shewanella]|uniref:Lipoprotein n=2 Tax=Unclassified Bacteria TaxID=49928 RepID=A0AAU6VX17_UNCXX|nr:MULTISPECIES: hypothetical protein [Shewanella]MBO2701791.1 hypothetical protein [Shewanella algae]MCT8981851.1 hypothetical protein [Shewanella algae]MDE0567979.1 hypothetical protein [Shewanella sp. K8]BCV33606.1 hypothetical protein TUM4442_31330 [Shewanella algae]BCV41918.1 hypothetical protein TUM17378_31800 [Shewanella algae]